MYEKYFYLASLQYVSVQFHSEQCKIWFTALLSSLGRVQVFDGPEAKTVVLPVPAMLLMEKCE